MQGKNTSTYQALPEDESELIATQTSPLNFELNPESIWVSLIKDEFRNTLKKNPKDIALDWFAIGLAAISSLIYVKPSIQLAELYGVIKRYLIILGTIGTNGILNLFFIREMLGNIFVRSNLANYNIDTVHMPTWEFLTKSIISVFAAAPLAYLSMDSILPEQFRIYMFFIQAFIYSSLQYYGVDRLVNKIIGSFKSEISNDSDVFAAALMENLQKRIDILKYEIKKQPDPKFNQLLLPFFDQINQLNERGIRDRSIQQDASVKLLKLLLELPSTEKSQPSKLSTWIEIAVKFSAMITIVPSLAGYLYSTVEGLDDQWENHKAAWIVGGFSMSVFSYLMGEVLNVIISNIASKIRELAQDGLPNSLHAWVNYFKRHFLSVSMSRTPLFSTTFLSILYLLSCNSYATSVWLQKQAAEKLFTFMLYPKALWENMVVINTVIFNSFGAFPVVDGSAATLVSHDNYQILINIYSGMIAELNRTNSSTKLALLRELFFSKEADFSNYKKQDLVENHPDQVAKIYELLLTSDKPEADQQAAIEKVMRAKKTMKETSNNSCCHLFRNKKRTPAIGDSEISAKTPMLP